MALRDESANRTNIGREPLEFEVGTLVGRRMVQHSNEEAHISSKFAVMSTGPYIIQEIANNGLTLRISHATDSARDRFSMPARECFVWTEADEERRELLTPTRLAETELQKATYGSKDERGIQRVRQNKPRDGGNRADEAAWVTRRDETEGRTREPTTGATRTSRLAG